MRKAMSLGALILFLASAAAAIQDEGLVLQRNDLLKNSFVSGDMAYSLSAPADVNVFLLVKDVNMAGGETAQSICDKINARRLKLYPDKEIALEVKIPPTAGNHGIGILGLYYYWNKLLSAGKSCERTVYSQLMDCNFILKYGKVNAFSKKAASASAPWVFWKTFSDTFIHSGWQHLDGPQYRGFKLTALLNTKFDWSVTFYRYYP